MEMHRPGDTLLMTISRRYKEGNRKKRRTIELPIILGERRLDSKYISGDPATWPSGMGNILIGFRTIEELPSGCKAEITISDFTQQGIRGLVTKDTEDVYGVNEGYYRLPFGNYGFSLNEEGNISNRTFTISSPCRSVHALIIPKLWKKPRNPDYKGGDLPLYSCYLGLPVRGNNLYRPDRKAKGLECGKIAPDPRSPLPVQIEY